MTVFSALTPAAFIRAMEDRPAAPAPDQPLPAPEEPTATAPFAFDPAVPAAPEEKPAPAEPKKTKKSKSGKAKKEEPKPSMFPAPDAPAQPQAEENGGTP